MKIVPSTRKISASGGTMTKMTCSASRDSNRMPSIRSQSQLTTATREGEDDADEHQ